MDLFINKKPQKLPSIALDFDRRLKAWWAMSDMFLDTDTSIWFNSVAEKLIKLNYTEQQLDYIFWQEVYPVLFKNLWFGEWVGFSREGIKTLVLERENSHWPKLRLEKRWRWMLGKMIGKDWQAVKEIMQRPSKN